MQSASQSANTEASENRWTERQCGWLAGLGTFLGLLGGLIGVSMGWWNSPALSVRLCGLGLVVSGISLIAGLAALFSRLPWHVCYPSLLIGCIGLAILGTNMREILRRFQADELRRMTAQDAC